MIEIMFIHHGSTRGGAPRSLAILISGLDKSVYHCTVVCRTDFDEAKKLFQSVGADVVYEPNIYPFHGSEVSGIDIKQVIYNFSHALSTFIATKRLLKQYRVDILHLNSTCLFMCAKAAKEYANDIKVVSHIREPLLNNLFGNLLKKPNLKYVDHFIAIDKYDGLSVDSYLHKTDVIYNAVDLEKYDYTIQSNVLRKKLSINENELVFLNMVRVSPENGILEIIRLWKDHYQELYNCHLVIVGEDPTQKTDYLKLVHTEAEGLSNVHILPFRKDTVEVLASSDVVLCSFIKPHFSRTIIEGYAMGKPCVASNVSGVDELVEESFSGFLFDIHSSDSFLAAINKIRNDNIRVSMSQNCLSEAIKKFSSKINLERTIKVYEQLLKR